MDRSDPMACPSPPVVRMPQWDGMTFLRQKATLTLVREAESESLSARFDPSFPFTVVSAGPVPVKVRAR